LTDAAFHSLASGSPPSSNDATAMRDFVAAQSTGVLCGIVAGWAVAVFAGSALTSRFSTRGQWPGWVVTALFLLATVANFAMVEHPTWMVVAAVVAIAAAGWFGSRLGAGAAGTGTH
jgi:hypothetical protein